MTTSSDSKQFSLAQSPDQWPGTLAAIRTELARREVEKAALGPSSAFVSFVEATTPGYQFGWFNREVCRRLDDFFERVKRKERPRLMLYAPPRHGKSELVSRKFPAYVLGRDPNMTVIATSYSADLSSRLNRDVQRAIDDPSYRRIFPKTRLNGTNIRTVAAGNWLRNSDVFEVVGHRGAYRSAGVGGGITGMGGDILIIDDPIKDAEQANSVVYREKVWEWYTSTLYTRSAPGGGILLIMTRWHMDDLAGRLLEAQAAGGEKWEVVSYPAIAEAEEAFRKAGEALHPERYNVEALDAIRGAVGSYVWNALYQQRPVAREGALFKWAWFDGKTIDASAVPVGVKWVRHWDLAASAKSNSARTAGVKIGRTPSGQFIVGHVVTTQQEGPDVRRTIRAVAETDGRECMISLPQDPGQAGKVQAHDMVVMLAGFDARAEPESGDKITRAMPFAAQCEAGNVQLVRGAWNENYVDELCQFPTGAFKDQVDASSGAFARLTAMPVMTFAKPMVFSRPRYIP